MYIPGRRSNKSFGEYLIKMDNCLFLEGRKIKSRKTKCWFSKICSARWCKIFIFVVSFTSNILATDPFFCSSEEVQDTKFSISRLLLLVSWKDFFFFFFFSAKVKQIRILHIQGSVVSFVRINYSTVAFLVKPPAFCLCYAISVCNYFYFNFMSFLTEARPVFPPCFVHNALFLDKMFFPIFSFFLLKMFIVPHE